MAMVRRVTISFTVSLWATEDVASDPTAADKAFGEAIERAGEGIVNAFVDMAPMVSAVQDKDEIFGVESAIGLGAITNIETEDGQ